MRCNFEAWSGLRSRRTSFSSYPSRAAIATLEILASRIVKYKATLRAVPADNGTRGDTLIRFQQELAMGRVKFFV